MVQLKSAGSAVAGGQYSCCEDRFEVAQAELKAEGDAGMCCGMTYHA